MVLSFVHDVDGRGENNLKKRVLGIVNGNGMCIGVGLLSMLFSAASCD